MEGAVACVLSGCPLLALQLVTDLTNAIQWLETHHIFTEDQVGVPLASVIIIIKILAANKKEGGGASS